ncbi:hypothetical protein [Streptomyces millisiae]|uniref:Uncharacterized protein n=1 Tax=Streptomyces millisiae TaxID=3075542 RepID=A0ABU2M1R7_9ACTN|nr:hypothetical protein [Streptomyces sp. DSM 44918]MDT0323218.1 hypothetical protein [Streptomyces sp. DSM 44918]
MGWAVLYIAFGVVALWLLGEVLLQYKARLRWRLVAFFGFLLVVLGVLMPSVPVIALGTIAFATGQTFVTLSFRRGFSTGWALGGGAGGSRRRREVGGPDDAAPELPPAPPAELPRADTPVEGVPALEPTTVGYDGGFPTDGAQQAAEQGYGEQHSYQEPYQQDAYAVGGDEIYGDQTGQPVGAGYQDYYQQQGYGYAQPEQQPYADATESYAAYSGDQYADYSATQAFPATDGQPTAQADAYPTTYTTGYATDQWSSNGTGDGNSYYQETPPGGVWVPQQRDAPNPTDAGYDYQAQQQPGAYPQQDGYDPTTGYYYNNDQRY